MTISQRKERYEKVFSYLKKQGFSQYKIAEMIDYDYTYINKIKKLKVEASDKVIKRLNEKFGINPDYLNGTSDIMIDINGSKLDSLEKIVNNWQTVEGKRNNYLHLIMDENFYKFLLDVDLEKLKEHSADLKERIDVLKARYSNTENLQEFVLVPRNEFMEIVSDNKKSRKHISELIDTIQYEDIIETSNVKLKINMKNNETTSNL